MVVEFDGQSWQLSSGPAESPRQLPRGHAKHWPSAPSNLPKNPALQPQRLPPSTPNALIGQSVHCVSPGVGATSAADVQALQLDAPNPVEIDPTGQAAQPVLLAWKYPGLHTQSVISLAPTESVVDSEKHRVQLSATVLLASRYVPRGQGKHSPTVPLSCPKKPGRHEHDVLSADDALFTGHERQVLAPNVLLIWLSPHAVQFVAVPSAEKKPGGHDSHVSHGVRMNPAEHRHALIAVDPTNDVRLLSGQGTQGSAGPAVELRKK